MIKESKKKLSDRKLTGYNQINKKNSKSVIVED